MRGVLLTALALTVLGFGVDAAEAQARDLPDVVARINGTTITRAQFEATWREVAAFVAAAKT